MDAAATPTWPQSLTSRPLPGEGRVNWSCWPVTLAAAHGSHVKRLAKEGSFRAREDLMSGDMCCCGSSAVTRQPRANARRVK
jgi:hypothetical protein